METVTLRVPKRGTVMINSNADDNAALLELAKSRRADGEFTSGEEYRLFLNNLINEAQNRKKGL